MNKWREKWRRCRWWVAGALVIVCVCGGLIYADVQREGKPIYSDTSLVPTMPVAIVFGAGINNAVVNDRVQTSVALYKAGKVRKLLMTGDNGRMNYDEPDAMKAYAVALGVPAKDVVCDYAGFRTYDSLSRARDIFGVRQAVLVSQRYHLPRALFIAHGLGINAVGADAARRRYGDQRWFNLREVGAVEAAWWDVRIWHRRPKFMGPKVSLFASV